MNKFKIFIIAIIALAGVKARAFDKPHHLIKGVNADVISTDTVQRGIYTLVFINKDTTFASEGSAVKQKMIDAFFDVYPREAKVFNEKAVTKVVFVIDPGYEGVAEADMGQVTFSSAYMLKQPTDIDVVTHEVMHIVQEYGYSAGPVWLTEGIADYVRFTFGIDNNGSGWSLPAYNSNQHYYDSYTISARFLVWIEKNVKPGTVKYLDDQLRLHSFTNDSWQTFTGASVDELWRRYTNNPSI